MSFRGKYVWILMAVLALVLSSAMIGCDAEMLKALLGPGPGKGEEGPAPGEQYKGEGVIGGNIFFGGGSEQPYSTTQAQDLHLMVFIFDRDPMGEEGPIDPIRTQDFTVSDRDFPFYYEFNDLAGGVDYWPAAVIDLNWDNEPNTGDWGGVTGPVQTDNRQADIWIDIPIYEGGGQIGVTVDYSGTNEGDLYIDISDATTYDYIRTDHFGWWQGPFYGEHFDIWDLPPAPGGYELYAYLQGGPPDYPILAEGWAYTDGNTEVYIQLSDVYVTSSTLKFWSWYQTESGTYYDKKLVEISMDAGATWETIAQISDSPDNPSSFPPNIYQPQSTWSPIEVPLTGYSGGDVYIRFTFDTVDSTANDYEGWYIDEVVIEDPYGNVIFSDPDYSSNWIFTGLWNQPMQRPYTGAYSLYYGWWNEATQSFNYDTGAANSGSAQINFSIYLP